MHICIYVFFHEQVLMNVIKKDYSKVRVERAGVFFKADQEGPFEPVGRAEAREGLDHAGTRGKRVQAEA